MEGAMVHCGLGILWVEGSTLEEEDESKGESAAGSSKEAEDQKRREDLEKFEEVQKEQNQRKVIRLLEVQEKLKGA